MLTFNELNSNNHLLFVCCCLVFVIQLLFCTYDEHLDVAFKILSSVRCSIICGSESESHGVENKPLLSIIKYVRYSPRYNRMQTLIFYIISQVK